MSQFLAKPMLQLHHPMNAVTIVVGVLLCKRVRALLRILLMRLRLRLLVPLFPFSMTSVMLLLAVARNYIIAIPTALATIQTIPV